MTPIGCAPIRVLLMARELDYGGIERDVSKFARHLSRYGVTPHVACFRPEVPGGRRSKRPAFPLSRFQ